MSAARNDGRRLTVVFLPAMLCNDELYHPQIEGLRDLVEPVVVAVADARLACFTAANRSECALRLTA